MWLVSDTLGGVWLLFLDSFRETKLSLPSVEAVEKCENIFGRMRVARGRSAESEAHIIPVPTSITDQLRDPTTESLPVVVSLNFSKIIADTIHTSCIECAYVV